MTILCYLYGRTSAVIPAALLTTAIVVSAGEAFSQSHLPTTERSGVFPDGQEWQITVPANWNGTVVNNLDRMRGRGADFFLSRGYAYTGTRRHPDRGWNWDPRAESNNMAKVLDLFEAEFGKPKRTIQFGCSGGGSVALSVAEDHPDRFDGVVAMHATSPITVANMRLDLTFVLKALLDASDQLPLIVSTAETDQAERVWVDLLTTAQATANGRARMALAGVLAQYPVWGSSREPVPKPDPGDLAAVEQALLRVVVEGASRAVTSRPQWDQPAGLMSWNTGIDYRQFYRNADPDHKQIVRNLYGQAGLHVERDLDADLERINDATRIDATPESVNYWRSRTHTGAIGVPVLQISTIGDAQTPAANMSSYKEAVTRAGRNSLYRQAFIDAAGHTFNDAEMAAAIEAVLRRIDTGTWGELTNPSEMNDLGREFGLGEPRFIRPGPHAGWSLPEHLNRAFFPDSRGPSGDELGDTRPNHEFERTAQSLR